MVAAAIPREASLGARSWRLGAGTSVFQPEPARNAARSFGAVGLVAVS